MPQACAGCGRRFVIVAGPALDPAVIPPAPHPNAYRIGIRWSMVVTYGFANLDPAGVTAGTLDPVVAMAPIDQVSIAFPDVVSIASWKNIAWTEAIVGILVPAPIALFSLWGAALAYKAPGVAAVFAVIGLAFGALAFYMIRRGFVIGRRHVRVIGRHAQLSAQHDKSPAFYIELFRRCGLAAPPIP
jgi:hypothetical protein